MRLFSFLLVLFLSACGSDSDPVVYRFPDASVFTGPGFAQTDDGILLTYLGRDGILVIRSQDGGETWEPFTELPYSPKEARMTVLPNGDIAMVVYNTWPPTDLGFIRSTDGGETWSVPTAIPVPPGYYSYGRITVHASSWSFSVYTETSESSQAATIWSHDEGLTWSAPVPVEHPTDGNSGLTEVAVHEYTPGGFVGAIRADRGIGLSEDGFYLSISDGSRWPIIAPIGSDTIFGDRGRMPMFLPLDDKRVILSYRLYRPPTLSAAFRIVNVDTLAITDVQTVGDNAGHAPFIYPHQGEWYALYQRVNSNDLVRRNVTALLAPASTA